jgi:hypothetical protein
MLSAIMGSGLGDISSIPGGLWEVFTGVWLIFKGFNASALEPAPTKAAANASEQMSLSKA